MRITLVGLCLAVGWSQAQTTSLEVKPAVELLFPTLAGRAYQLRNSENMVAWSPLGHPVLGGQGTARVLVPASSARGYFRLDEHPVRDLNALLEPIRLANQVPALACAVIRSNRIVGVGAVGLRKTGVTNAPVTVEDKWHHGSLTKSMTATLAALLVQRGSIRWNTTLAEVFPDWAPTMHAQWRGATLEQLSSNRGGAPNDLNSSGIWSQLWSFGGTPRDARRFLLEKLTVLAPSAPPGSRYEYSNAGFALAGHMLETVMNKPWEELITDELFAPLGMTSAGFGVPATPRHLNQPWGHQWSGGKPVPVEPGTSADNPPAIGPAGTVHCSVVDLAKYVAFHLAGDKADTSLLPQTAFEKLHTAYPNNSNYAHGWTAVSRTWAGDRPALSHAGSNTQWYSVIWMAPARDFGVVAICNLATASGANPGATASDQVTGKMIAEFLN